MVKISITLTLLFFWLFTFSLAKTLPENDVNPLIRLPSDQSNAVVEESSSDSNAVESSTVTTVPLTAIGIRPINRRFPNKPCHHNKIHPENQLQILSSGENFKDPEAIHGGSHPWMRPRRHHHRRRHHHDEDSDSDSDSDSDDDDEDDHYKRIGSKRFDRFNREKKMMKKRFGPWEEHHKRVAGRGGFMKRVKNFFEQYF